jgi:hypothetical protein
VEINLRTEAGTRSESGEFSAITFPSLGFIISKPGDANDFALMYFSREWSA